MDISQPDQQLPLISLQPVTDAEHGWVAMLLHADPLPDVDAQSRLFAAGGLAQALDGLPCILPAFGSGEIAPADGFIHRIPAAAAGDPASPVAPLPPQCAGGGPCLAIGVDSMSAFDRCRKAGFTWFAGNYALHPMPGTRTRNATRHALVLELLTLITHEADSRQLENVIKRDPQISYQLLRLVNSVAFAPGRTITSFNHAITMLGRKPMQRWLQLLLYARPGEGGHSPLLPRAAMRAALMEGLFSGGTEAMRELAFMAGMFSLLDVMLNESMAKLIAPLRLAIEVNRALVERGGVLGPALRAVVAAETGDTPLAEALAAAKIGPNAWGQALVGACRWAVHVSREA